MDLLQELYSTGLLVGLLVDAELARISVPDRLFSFIGWVTRLEPVTPSTLAAETGLPPTTIRDYVRELVASVLGVTGSSRVTQPMNEKSRSGTLILASSASTRSPTRSPVE